MILGDRGIIALFAALVLTSVVFIVFPQIDIETSNLAWNGNNFLFDKKGLGAVFTIYFHVGMRIIFFTYLIMGGLLLLIGKAPGWLTLRSYAFIVLSVAISAGLVTNVVLKDHWGRARPVQIEQFGGTRAFTPVWIVSDQCNRNCSFPGGDVSFAFCALAPALLARRKRMTAISLAAGFGCLIGFGRIAAGAHFLSDCVVAALLTSLIVLLLYRLQVIQFKDKTHVI